jgi:hypothetical protein
MNKKYYFGFIFALIFLLQIPIAPVYADIAPPSAVGIGGLKSSGDEVTNVQMTFERVELEILEIPPDQSPTKRYSDHQVAVNAWFILHNTGKTEENMQVVFPLSDFNDCGRSEYSAPRSRMKLRIARGSFKATIDGSPAMITEVIVRDNKYSDCNFYWAGFDVTFPVDRDVMVRVSYFMDNSGQWSDSPALDSVESFEYILETGAGWKGPISKGYVVVRFPYKVEDNILEGTSSGYKTEDNEITWTFENLEPTAEDNIAVGFVEPGLWRNIKIYRQKIANDPADVQSWISLARMYHWVGYINGSRPRNSDYVDKTNQAYERALKLNPNSSELCVAVAQYVASQSVRDIPPRVIQLLEKALQLNPSNTEALAMIRGWNININLPPTFTPTPTLKISSTPRATLTPLATFTPRSTTPPGAIRSTTALPSPAPTQVLTREPTRPAAPTLEALPASATPVVIVEPKDDRLLWLIPDALLVAAVAIVLATFWRKRRM